MIHARSRRSPRYLEAFETDTRPLREIADAFVIEESTVKTHVKRILRKLRLCDRVQVVILAYQSGLTQPGPQTRA